MEDRHSAAGQATNCARRTVPVTKIPTKSKDKSKDRPEDSKLLSQKERRDVLKVKSRHPTMKNRPLSRTVGAKELKENLAPNDRPAFLPKKGSAMSYTELKRVNQEVLAEMQALREKSECDESRHLETIRQLTQEILEYKEKHVELKHEIETYQENLASKTSELTALQDSLEDIKFENERIINMLEGAKIDARTGLRVRQSENFVKEQQKMEMELDSQSMEFDDFITSLDSTISQLQEQESSFRALFITS